MAYTISGLQESLRDLRVNLNLAARDLSALRTADGDGELWNISWEAAMARHSRMFCHISDLISELGEVQAEGLEIAPKAPQPASHAHRPLTPQAARQLRAVEAIAADLHRVAELLGSWDERGRLQITGEGEQVELPPPGHSVKVQP